MHDWASPDKPHLTYSFHLTLVPLSWPFPWQLPTLTWSCRRWPAPQARLCQLDYSRDVLHNTVLLFQSHFLSKNKIKIVLWLILSNIKLCNVCYHKKTLSSFTYRHRTPTTKTLPSSLIALSSRYSPLVTNETRVVPPTRRKLDLNCNWHHGRESTSTSSSLQKLILILTSTCISYWLIVSVAVFNLSNSI